MCVLFRHLGREIPEGMQGHEFQIKTDAFHRCFQIVRNGLPGVQGEENKVAGQIAFQ
jgi:hypothetical protein